MKWWVLMTVDKNFYEKKIQTLTDENHKLKRKIKNLKGRLKSIQNDCLVEETVNESVIKQQDYSTTSKEQSHKSDSVIDKYASPT